LPPALSPTTICNTTLHSIPTRARSVTAAGAPVHDLSHSRAFVCVLRRITPLDFARRDV
jgi:hypothetical protein